MAKRSKIPHSMLKGYHLVCIDRGIINGSSDSNSIIVAETVIKHESLRFRDRFDILLQLRSSVVRLMGIQSLYEKC